MTDTTFRDGVTDHADGIADRSVSTTDSSPDRYNHRLGLPPRRRLALATGAAFTGGAFLGTIQGVRVAGLRFRAENSHRLPRSEAGWLLYHKAKRKYVFKASMKEARSLGFRVAPCVALFYFFEEAMDERRSKRVGHMGENTHQDFLSSTFAGLGVAGAFGLWNRLTLPLIAKMAKYGMIGGVSYGLIQDALHLSHGRELAYVESIRQVLGYGETEGNETTHNT
ncbi:MAG: hypothetical protein M1828_003786 [Chrysothrix sp. TS-e1954]|nr:MAG: hypothetical protein M1828_003786 [Chrysothrix sp. TS-e1954]